MSPTHHFNKSTMLMYITCRHVKIKQLEFIWQLFKISVSNSNNACNISRQKSCPNYLVLILK